RCRIFVGHVLLGGEQDEGVGPHHLLEREDRLLASDEEGHDHVRKYDGVAQWQHRIGSGFTWRKQWAWLYSGHGSKSFLLSLSATTSPCAATTACRRPGRRNRSDIRAQRAGMIPCLSSQNFIRLKKLNDSRPFGSVSRPLKGVRNDRRARSSSVVRLKPDRTPERCSRGLHRAPPPGACAHRYRHRLDRVCVSDRRSPGCLSSAFPAEIHTRKLRHVAAHTQKFNPR